MLVYVSLLFRDILTNRRIHLKMKKKRKRENVPYLGKPSLPKRKHEAAK